MYSKFFKRLIDLLASVLGLILVLPVFILITVFLYFVNGGKPFFIQRRPGLNGKIFKIIKFKTMNDKKDLNGNLLPDEKRLTAIGKFVRKTSLDEIPQLINVFIGEMSLVGPRPLLPEYLELYSEEQAKRHNVKPGITGWAQVNGRNAISWREKLALDVWYVEHIGFVLDIKILIKTVVKVIKSEDINTKGKATTEAFNGNN